VEFSEDMFRRVLEQSPLSVQLFDATGNAVFANEAWERIWESKREDLEGYNLFRDPQLEALGFVGMIRRALDGERINGPQTLYDPRKNGKEGRARWTTGVLYPLKDASGKVTGLALLHRDVTERAEAEEAVRSLNAELERKLTDGASRLQETARELEAFSRSVSHDLRAPARHIGGFLELLRTKAEPSLDPGGKRYLDIIADSVKRLDGLIEDLTLFSRIGRQDLAKVRFKMSELVFQCIREQDRAAAATSRRVAWQIGELPDCVSDLTLMREVWTQLISNAVKFTRRREEARIEIGSEIKDGRPAYFIRDNGAGFDMVYSSKLFDPFQRLHGATEFEGNGMGLATVRRILQRHGSSVWAEGEPGKGATFWFSVPEGA
jgi:PAS domain S-box-containing protein